MAYIIGQPGGPAGPFYSVVRSDGRVVAMQIVDEAWAKRIVAGLTLLDASEKDHRVESYIEALKKGAGDE